MHRFDPSENDTATETLNKRLCDDDAKSQHEGKRSDLLSVAA